VRRELITRANDWRQVLTKDPAHARPVITSLLDGRVTVTPTAERGRWELTGTGTIAGLFSAEILQEGWRPHREPFTRCK
jgi:hypothetical protein